METVPTESLEQEKLSTSIPTSSKGSQDDDGISQLMSKDPALIPVIKTSFWVNWTRRTRNWMFSPRTCEETLTQMQSMQSVEVELQRSEDTGREVLEGCLCLPATLRRILEQFSDKELIHLSLVNKRWNYEARSLLRDRGRLVATISSTPACLKLDQFASDLGKMRVVPFSGLHLDLGHTDDGSNNNCPSIIPTGSVHSSLQVILDRLPWKHLSVGFYGHDWGECKNCPALVLVTKILEDHCGELEQLSISNVDGKKTEFLRSILGHRSLPCLKVFKVQEELTDDPLTNGFMRAMVSRAQNLKEFHIAGRMEFSENVMKGSSGVLVAASGLNPLCEKVCESLIPSLRTANIDVFCAYGMEFDVELLNRVVPRLIQASQKTLTSLQMDLLFAVPLMSYEICLENVTELCFYVSYPLLETTPTNVKRLVRSLNFARLFPKLSRVKIAHWQFRNFSYQDIGAFVKNRKELVRNAAPDRAINIRHLELCYLEEVTPPLIFLARMFPHVKTISVQTTAGHKLPFKLLWQHFSCLAELRIDLTESSSSVQLNWDGAFCGIFPEEVAELRMKDDDYLKAVNLVPVMPSIRCLRDLRSFSLRFSSRVCKRVQDPTRIFSKVTGMIGFPRCPILSVKLQTTLDTAEALDHMKPYVTVVTESPNR